VVNSLSTVSVLLRMATVDSTSLQDLVTHKLIRRKRGNCCCCESRGLPVLTSPLLNLNFCAPPGILAK
jgi:hypothetical protein